MICPSKVESGLGRDVIRYAESELPTRYGTARLFVYREVGPSGVPDPNKEHVALVFGELGPRAENVPCRVHSECITSEVFGSLKCDCREQLEEALRRLSSKEQGILLYLRQEGRGIGLGNKIRAYALQNSGVDTIEANHQLGFESDLRTYDIAAGMLHELGVKSVKLLTNNPEKIAGLEEYGIRVVERLPVEVPPNDHSEAYLATKREKCGHLLSVFD